MVPIWALRYNLKTERETAVTAPGRADAKLVSTNSGTQVAIKKLLGDHFCTFRLTFWQWFGALELGDLFRPHTHR